MKFAKRFIRFGAVAAVCAALLSFSPRLRAAEIPKVSPESVGMSSAKLKQVDAIVNRLIAEHKLAGATVAVARHGKIVHSGVYGLMDVDAKKPMREDAIFRIYSMSKGITTAAAMILYDEGKFGLDDPVSKYLPEFEGLKVYGKNGNVAPKREMTVRDLMRHTSGLTYGFFGNHPVDQQYRTANVSDMDADLVALTGKLGKLPLMYEPGTDWIYSLSVDVLGRLVEVWSGQSFDVFLQKRMFDPLDMKDTGFAVAKSELDRFAQYYTPDGKGKFEVIDEVSNSDYLAKRKLLSGGGGLASTTRDYMRFLVMIQNGGKLGNVRILKKKTVKMMIVNQVPDEAMPIAFGGIKRGGVGFGLGFSVRVANSAWDPTGRVGEYGWGGLASTHYWVSPKDDLIVVTMEQTAPFSFLLEWGLKGAIYDAIEKK